MTIQDATRRAHRALAGSRLSLVLTAAGVTVVASAVVLAVATMVSGGEGAAPAPESAAPQPASVVPRTIDSERLGMEMQLPASWHRQPGKDVLKFVSADRSMAVSLAATPPTLSRVDVRDATVEQLQGNYERVRVLERSERSIGQGLPALTAELVGRRDDGSPIRMLVASVRSSWRTYSVTVFSRGAPPRKAAVETALLLRSLQLKKPKS